MELVVYYVAFCFRVDDCLLGVVVWVECGTSGKWLLSSCVFWVYFSWVIWLLGLVA